MDYTILPLINAMLNSLSLVFITMGFIFIKQKKEQAHKKSMFSAIISSTLFLMSYVLYHVLKYLNTPSGQSLTTPYPDVSPWNTIYYLVLRTHSILAMLVVVLVILAVRYALKDQRESHKKVVKWAFPIWLYVSVTGIVIYLMLYPFKPVIPA